MVHRSRALLLAVWLEQQGKLEWRRSPMEFPVEMEATLADPRWPTIKIATLSQSFVARGPGGRWEQGAPAPEAAVVHTKVQR